MTQQAAAEPEIARIAGKQLGVIGERQLQALGFGRTQIRSRIARGILHPLYPGAFAVGHRKITPHAWLFAALLSCGPSSFLSHRTAAAVYGLRVINIKAIELTVPTTKAPRRKQLIVHRTSLTPEPADITVRNGMKLSSIARMLVELAPRESPAELDRLITQSVRKNLLDVAAVELALNRYAGFAGLAKLKTALTAYRPRPDRKSNLELAFDELLAHHPEIPQPLRNIQIGPWEIDCYWPAQRLAVELDGRPYHIAAQDFEKDRLKDAYLLKESIRPLRITGFRFEHEPGAVFADLQTLLHQAA